MFVVWSHTLWVPIAPELPAKFVIAFEADIDYESAVEETIFDRKN